MRVVQRTHLLWALISLALSVSFSASSAFAFSSSTESEKKPLADQPVGGFPDFVSLAEKVVPSVVNISTVSFAKAPSFGGPPDELFRRFFEEFFRGHGMPFPGGPKSPPGREEAPKNIPRAMALGTGFIIDEEGLILTNNHVVSGADEIKISFTQDPSEKPTDGEVVGRDPELDLALIKVKTRRKLVPLPMGDSSSVKVGEYVAAVGNPFGQGHSVTHGIISAKERQAPDFVLASYIQTDAPINPGNSGGPLVNMSGQVIGINNAIEARAQGIGFAIPIDLVKQVLPELKTKGTVSRGFIGVLVEPLTPELAEKFGLKKDQRAALVTHVVPEGPAAESGIVPYDVILSFGGQEVGSPTDLIRAVTAAEMGEKVTAVVWSGGKEKKLKIEVGQRPSRHAREDSQSRPEKKSQKTSVNTGMELGELDARTRKQLGVSSEVDGVVVVSTQQGGPADRAGILMGDLILEVDRKPVKSVQEFNRIVDKADRSYLVRLRRGSPHGGEAFTVVVLEPTSD